MLLLLLLLIFAVSFRWLLPPENKINNRWMYIDNLFSFLSEIIPT